jgi:hypothetical protein
MSKYDLKISRGRCGGLGETAFRHFRPQLGVSDQKERYLICVFLEPRVRLDAARVRPFTQS